MAVMHKALRDSVGAASLVNDPHDDQLVVMGAQSVPNKYHDSVAYALRQVLLRHVALLRCFMQKVSIVTACNPDIIVSRKQ